jgi:hypothetical protein
VRNLYWLIKSICLSMTFDCDLINRDPKHAHCILDSAINNCNLVFIKFILNKLQFILNKFPETKGFKGNIMFCNCVCDLDIQKKFDLARLHLLNLWSLKTVLLNFSYKKGYDHLNVIYQTKCIPIMKQTDNFTKLTKADGI